jgi:hypothetical protein
MNPRARPLEGRVFLFGGIRARGQTRESQGGPLPSRRALAPAKLKGLASLSERSRINNAIRARPRAWVLPRLTLPLAGWHPPASRLNNDAYPRGRAAIRDDEGVFTLYRQSRRPCTGVAPRRYVNRSGLLRGPTSPLPSAPLPLPPLPSRSPKCRLAGARVIIYTRRVDNNWLPLFGNERRLMHPAALLHAGEPSGRQLPGS